MTSDYWSLEISVEIIRWASGSYSARLVLQWLNNNEGISVSDLDSETQHHRRRNIKRGLNCTPCPQPVEVQQMGLHSAEIVSVSQYSLAGFFNAIDGWPIVIRIYWIFCKNAIQKLLCQSFAIGTFKCEDLRWTVWRIFLTPQAQPHWDNILHACVTSEGRLLNHNQDITGKFGVRGHPELLDMGGWATVRRKVWGNVCQSDIVFRERGRDRPRSRCMTCLLCPGLIPTNLIHLQWQRHVKRHASPDTFRGASHCLFFESSWHECCLYLLITHTLCVGFKITRTVAFAVVRC